MPFDETKLPKPTELDIRHIAGFLQSGSEAPAGRPRSFWQQLRIVDGSLRFYDTVLNDWFSTQPPPPVSDGILVRVTSASGFDLTSTTPQNVLFAGSDELFLSHIVVKPENVVSLSAPPEISFGITGGNYDDVIPATTLTGFDTGKRWVFAPAGLLPILGASTLRLKVHTPATASSFDASVQVFGTYNN